MQQWVFGEALSAELANEANNNFANRIAYTGGTRATVSILKTVSLSRKSMAHFAPVERWPQSQRNGL